jgi:hypothetical protein
MIEEVPKKKRGRPQKPRISENANQGINPNVDLMRLDGVQLGEILGLTRFRVYDLSVLPTNPLPKNPDNSYSLPAVAAWSFQRGKNGSNEGLEREKMEAEVDKKKLECDRLRFQLEEIKAESIRRDAANQHISALVSLFKSNLTAVLTGHNTISRLVNLPDVNSVLLIMRELVIASLSAIVDNGNAAIKGSSGNGK